MAVRKMELTPELVALCHREECAAPPDARLELLTDEDFDQMAQQLASENREGALWVFAYGSLIWKPEFETVERRRSTAFGWHRSFCIELNSWRGTPQQPGLMMALERGGRCDGVVYRLPADNLVKQIERLLRREMTYRQNANAVRWMPTVTAEGPIKALGFWVGPNGDRILSKQPLDKVAAILARACGHLGSGAEYLYKTVLHLEEFGIHDRNLWALQKLVANEITALHLP
ncbi:MAG: cation transporter [Rhizobium sp.]|nr:cation transporter [Rhizobium sp.]